MVFSVYRSFRVKEFNLRTSETGINGEELQRDRS